MLKQNPFVMHHFVVEDNGQDFSVQSDLELFTYPPNFFIFIMIQHNNSFDLHYISMTFFSFVI